MYHTITESEFIDAFRGSNGWSDTYKNNFSYYALLALFEYLENLEDDTGEKLEFNRVELIGDYNEYNSLKEFQSDYGKPEIKTLDDLSDHTTVIKVDDPDRVGAFIMGVF
jgi:hypothetical protein|tara:strand:+ start:490 stop:819 length:330 start_codon:yes stop_codon:yes gene_type:complete